MQKWLREHNKHLLAALVVLLMLTFLIQDTLSGRSEAARIEAWGTLRGTSLTNVDFQEAQRVVGMLTTVGPLLWQEPWLLAIAGQNLNQQNLMMARFYSQLKPLTVEEFAVLRFEARLAGIDVSPDSIDGFVAAFGGMPLVNAIRRQHSVTEEQARDAFADVLRVNELASQSAGALMVGDAELRHFARDMQDRVTVELVSFPSDQFVDEGYAPPDAELQAQFERFRDQTAPEDGKGYGYKWPRRIAVEALRVPVAELQASVTITDEAVRQYYRKNREQYLIPPEEAAAASAPASAPASASGPTYKPLREVRAEIEKELREAGARSRARQFAGQLAADLARPWADLSRDKDGYYPRPAGVDSAGYLAELAAKTGKQLGCSIEVRAIELVSAADMADHDLLGKLQPDSNQPEQYRPAEYLFRVPAFHKVERAGDSQPVLSLYEPSQVAYAQSDDKGEVVAYLVLRVIEARESESPKSLAECRERVAKDLRLMAADKIADEHANRLYVAAQKLGVKAALEADPGLKAMLTKPKKGAAADAEPPDPLLTPSFARQSQSFTGAGPTFVPGMGQSEAAIEAVFEMTSEAWTSPPASAPAATQVAAPATQPAPKVRLIHLPESHNRVVVELKKHEPVREDVFTSRRDQFRMQAVRQRRLDAFKSWFDRNTLYARAGFVHAPRETIESDASTAATR